MGNMRACYAVALIALAACGSDSKAVDASIQIKDSTPIDSKVFNDAPPPNYDLTCLNNPAPTTATDPITIAGNTVELSQSSGAIPGVTVDVFKTGTATALATVTSDTAGAFATGNIATATTPIDGYVRAVAPLDGTNMPVYRTTYMYPPSVVATSLTDVPVLMLSVATFAQLGASQQDS
ncbi:MAG TPA: hypothetical protein VIV40_07660, partial [Kofleriaceae bacterium]